MRKQHPACAVCGGKLEISDQYPQAGYLHADNADDTHAPRLRKERRISRPCYDKFWRCPGWAGGGERYAKVQRCNGGSLPSGIFTKKFWRWRVSRCQKCGVTVLPYVIRYGDWRWWRAEARHQASEAKYRLQDWLGNRR